MPQGVRMHTAHPGPAQIPPDALAVAARFHRPLSAARRNQVSGLALPRSLRSRGEIVRDGISRPELLVLGVCTTILVHPVPQ